MLFQNDRAYTPREIREILKIPENKFNPLVRDGVIPLNNFSARIRRGIGGTLNEALEKLVK